MRWKAYLISSGPYVREYYLELIEEEGPVDFRKDSLGTLVLRPDHNAIRPLGNR